MHSRLLNFKLFYALLFLIPSSAVSQKTTLNSILAEIDFQEDSIRSVFDWVAQNISYEVQLVGEEPSAGSTDEIIDYVLTSKQGVCRHYAELFRALISEIGYEVYVVTGYTKDFNSLANVSHAWNAVKTSRGWFLYDPTWSSGHLEEGEFVRKADDLWYEVKPDEFIYTHVPFDPIWQLSNYPVIAKVKNVHLSLNLYLNYEDSIRTYSRMDSLESLKNEMHRVSHYSDSNFHVREHLSYLQKKEAYYETNISIDLFNEALDLYNEAVSLYNQYITSKNRYFRKPKKSIDELNGLLSLARDKLSKVKAVINADYAQASIFDESRSMVNENFNSVLKAVQKELIFMKKCEHTWPPLRWFKFRSL
ncbi:MAG: transglutaminase domain-containing protein [Bacteroidota bacterium]